MNACCTRDFQITIHIRLIIHEPWRAFGYQKTNGARNSRVKGQCLGLPVQVKTSCQRKQEAAENSQDTRTTLVSVLV